MGSEVSICFYLVIGIGVAAAFWIGNDPRSEGIALFQTLTAPIFWPIYIPLLLTRRSQQPEAVALTRAEFDSEHKPDGMDLLIKQVECELDAALQSLDGWVDNALGGEQHHIAELRVAWRDQASRIRELDRLLSQSSAEIPTGRTASVSATPASVTVASITTPSTASDESILPSVSDDSNRARVSEFEQSRNENVLKLRQLRRQMYDDLLATLAWVRELVTMIHLAKYSGAPASRALELVRQIAAAVEGLSKINRSTTPS